MNLDLSSEDIKELEHIEAGGSWCLDGRKERRLIRLGLLERTGIHGLRISSEGIAELNRAFGDKP